LEGRQEIGEPAVQVPVGPNVARRAELGGPGDELAALRIGLLPDRIDDDLADVEPAALDEALAAEIRLPAGDAAPHVDARVYGRSLIRVELPANDRVNAVAGDRDRASRKSSVRKAHGGAVAVLLDRLAALPQRDGIVAEPLAHRLDQHAVQLPAVDRELRPFVSGVTAARFLVDELPEAVVEAHLARQHRMSLQALGETE